MRGYLLRIIDLRRSAALADLSAMPPTLSTSPIRWQTPAPPIASVITSYSIHYTKLYEITVVISDNIYRYSFYSLVEAVHCRIN